MTRTKWNLQRALVSRSILVALIGLISPLGAAQAQDAVRLPSSEGVSVLPIRDVWSRRNYAEIEYLVYSATGNELPALITPSSVADFGVIGQPSTRVVSSDEVSLNGMQGGRVTFGRWLDESLTWAVEAELMAAGISKGEQFFVSQFNPVLARPFLNAQTGQEDAQLVAHPDPPPDQDPTDPLQIINTQIQGTIGLDPTAELYSVDILSRHRWLEHSHGNLDFFCGYRFFRFRESLEIRESVLVSRQGLLVVPGQLPAPFDPGPQFFDVFDRFTVENDFHGVDLGSKLTLRRGPFEANVFGKAALGHMSQTVTIDGATTLTVADSADTTTGGWLAAPSNIGRRTDHDFAVIPEFGVRLAVLAVEGVEIHVGYSALYLSSVLRSGDQIDTRVDPSQLADLPIAEGGAGPSADRPEPRFLKSDMWFYGFNFGVQVNW